MSFKRSTALSILLAVFLSWPLNPAIGAAKDTNNSTEGSVGGPMAGTIGGPFTLVDHNGQTVNDTDFHGNYALIYFGYTFCPDVCPTSLVMMSQALDRLGEDAQNITPILITIDPERDTLEHLKAYVPHFHPRLVGLTGTPAQVAVATKAYKVYVEKVFEQGWGVDEYFVYHSDVVYFMGPNGQYLDHFRSGTTPKTMARRILQNMQKNSGNSPTSPN